MKRAPVSGGFLLCLVLNVIFNAEWGMLALILLVLHVWIGLPVIFVYLSLALWIIIALSLTLLFSWGSRCSTRDTEPKANMNPYSSNANPYSSKPQNTQFYLNERDFRKKED